MNSDNAYLALDLIDYLTHEPMHACIHSLVLAAISPSSAYRSLATHRHALWNHVTVRRFPRFANMRNGACLGHLAGDSRGDLAADIDVWLTCVIDGT